MTYSIAFTSNPIIIETDSELSVNSIDYLQKLADITAQDLTHTVYNSSAYRFNEASVGHTTIVTKNFMQFFSKLFLFLENEHSSGLISDVFVGNDFTFDDLHLDTTHNVIIKKKQVYIDSLSITTMILLEEIQEYLKTLAKKSFSIRYSYYFATYGESLEKWMYMEDEGILYEGFPSYPVIAIFNVKQEFVELKPEQFAKSDRLFNPAYLIISAPSFKAIAHHKAALKQFAYESDFTEYLWQHDVSVSIIDHDRNLITLRI